jgi:hypothetical protein
MKSTTTTKTVRLSRHERMLILIYRGLTEPGQSAVNAAVGSAFLTASAPDQNARWGRDCRALELGHANTSALDPFLSGASR